MKWAQPLLVVMIGACGACAHQQSQVQVREVIRQVPVPSRVVVPVACIEPRAIPAEPKRVSGRFTGDARHDLQILAANSQDLRGWGETLHRLLSKCARAGATTAGSGTRPPKG